MAEETTKTFDEVIAEAGSTLESKYAEAVAKQQAAIEAAATPEGTTPPPAPSTPGDAAAGENAAPTTEGKDADGFDPDKTLSRYKTQEEKDAALVEKDRELLKRAKQNEERDAEIARLKADNDNLRAGKPPAAAPATPPEAPPAPAAKPEPKGFRPWLEEVVTVEKPESLPLYLRPVHEEFSKLRAGKVDLESTGAKIEELKTKEGTLTDEIRTLDLEIGSLSKAINADPDSLAVREMLDQAKATRAQKDMEYARTQTSRSILASELATKSSAFKEARDRYESSAVNLHRDIQKHEDRAQESSAEDERLRTSWKTAIKTKVLDRTDLDADSKASIVESLEARLNRIDGDLPADFGPWVDGQKDVFARELRKSANGAAAAANREAGNAPRTPSNGSAPHSEAPKKGARKENIDSVMGEASKKFEGFFARN